MSSRYSVSGGRCFTRSQSTVYWPVQPRLAPISLFRISAMSEGMAISEVPVSIAAPVLSSSSSSLPKPTLSSVTSQ